MDKNYKDKINSMKKTITVLSAVLVLAASAFAQDTFYPGWQFGIKGGVGYTVGETNNISDLLSPAAGLEAGYQFTPTFTLRADLSGWQGKAYVPKNEYGYAFNYAQLAVDGLFDIRNLFGGYKERCFNPYALVGVGANYRFNNGADETLLPADNLYWSPSSIGPVVRLGIGSFFKVNDKWGIFAEVVENANTDTFNSKLGTQPLLGIIDIDHQINALVGVKFTIDQANKKAAALAAAAAAEAAAAEAAAKAAAEKAAAEKAAAEKAAAEKAAAEKAAAEAAAAEAARLAAEKAAAEKAAYEALKAQSAEDAIEAAKNNLNNVYYLIGKTIIRSSEMYKVNKLIKYLNENPDATAIICGFADKPTGTPEGNMILSENRAKSVLAELMKAGIDPARVTLFWYGDTVQVSKVQEKNRVSVLLKK